MSGAGTGGEFRDRSKLVELICRPSCPLSAGISLALAEWLPSLLARITLPVTIPSVSSHFCEFTEAICGVTATEIPSPSGLLSLPPSCTDEPGGAVKGFNRAGSGSGGERSSNTVDALRRGRAAALEACGSAAVGKSLILASRAAWLCPWRISV